MFYLYFITVLYYCITHVFLSHLLNNMFHILLTTVSSTQVFYCCTYPVFDM